MLIDTIFLKYNNKLKAEEKDMYCVRWWFTLRALEKCACISYKNIVDDVYQITLYSLYEIQNEICLVSVPGIVIILIFRMKKLRLIEVK